MVAALIKKAYDTNLPTAENLPLIPNKSALKTFNCFAYDCEISDALVACYLLGLPNHYTLSDNVKSINWGMIQRQFPDFAQCIYQYTSDVDNFMKLRRKRKTLYTAFEHYSARGIQLNHFCFYIYTHMISIYPCKLAQKSDIEFDHGYKNWKNQVQCHFTKPGSKAEVKLLDQL